MGRDDDWIVWVMTHPMLIQADRWVDSTGLFPVPGRVVVFAAPLLALFILIWILVTVFVDDRGAQVRPGATLIAGPLGSGKTTLWHLLRFGRAPQTVTSMRPNDAVFRLRAPATASSAKNNNNDKNNNTKGKMGVDRGVVVATDEDAVHSGAPLDHVVDLPGHPRLAALRRDFSLEAARVVVVVDAADVKAQVRPCADLFYSLLTDEKLVARDVPVLVACNKVDRPSAKSGDLVATALERELNALARSRLSQPGDTGGAEAGERLLVARGETFSWDEAPLRVTFAETSFVGEGARSSVAVVAEFIATEGPSA